MADGASTGTPLSKEEIKETMVRIYEQLRNRVPGAEYGDKIDLVVEMCMNRVSTVKTQACCEHHLRFDVWTDGFLVGLMAAALGIITLKVKATDA